MGTLPPFPRDFSLCARILGRRRCNHLRRIPAPKSALELRLRSALSSVSARTILTEYTWPQCCNDVSLPHTISRLMALAIHFEGLVSSGAVRNYRELAEAGQVAGRGSARSCN